MGRQSKYPNKAGIYKLTCSVTGKSYIGKSVNIRIRINHHKRYDATSKYNSYLKNAIVKYGWDSFNVEILEIVENFDKLKDNKNLLCRESYFIELFDSINKDKGYNICKFSSDVTGLPRSIETRNKISNSMMGRTFSKESREKMSIGKSGKPISEEHKNNIRLSKLGKPNLGRLGKVCSDETKEKIRQSMLGKNTKPQ